MDIIRNDNFINVPKDFFYLIKDLSVTELKAYLLLLRGDVADLSRLAMECGASDITFVLSRLSSKGLIKYKYYDGEPTITICDRCVLDDTAAPVSLMEKIEQIKGSPLTSSEMETISFISETLSFSDELLCFLADICRADGKFGAKYIKSVALSWHDAGIDSIEKAKSETKRYSGIVYLALNHLGRNGRPAPAESELIMSWVIDYGMGEDMILYVCDKAAVSTDRNRLRYASAIMDYYHRNDIRTRQQAESMPKPEKNSSLGKFMQRTSEDFAELERKLLEN